MFYPVTDKSLVLRKGDILAARCTMDNYQDKWVLVGPTGDDEMCNFYIMYYVDGDKILKRNMLFSSGPPLYYWAHDKILGRKIPKIIDQEASKL